MGAISATLLTFLSCGDHLISSKTLYGCTHSLIENHLSRFGIEFSFVDLNDPECLVKNMKKNTKIIYIETPANPTLEVINLDRISKHAKILNKDCLIVVDNTFASPIMQKPLNFGCDIVVHSMTKYINGHSDVVAGCVCASNQICSKIRMEGLKDITGSVLSPHDAFLIIRGLMTLDMRVKTATSNAEKIAMFLDNHPKIEKVYYPGLKSHPQFEIAKKQMIGFGAMLSFEVKGGIEAGRKLLDGLKLCTLAVSLGGVETLIEHPASQTHACIPKKDRLAAGISDGLVRLSVGCENVDDLINDFKQSLEN